MEQKEIDALTFEQRKEAAVPELNAVLLKYHIGCEAVINLVDKIPTPPAPAEGVPEVQAETPPETSA